MRGRNLFTVNRARNLRRESTPAERKLWDALRNRQLDGMKFVRQEPVGPYIADLICRSEGLIIEVDGPTHDAPEAQAYDQRRTDWLQREGYKVLRFTNEDVFGDLEPLLASIRLAPTQR